MAVRNEIDVLNLPILLAAEMAFQQVERLLAQTPNPLGEVPEGQFRGKLSLDEIKRLMQGG